MNKEKLSDITKELQTKYPESGITSIELDDTGKAVFNLKPTNTNLAVLDNNKALIPRIYENASVINRDAITRSDIDLMAGDLYNDDPHSLFNKAIKYYYTDGIVGTVVNLKASLAAKGFENDIDDPDIKNFYDTWCMDINLKELIDYIFLDFFKVGQVVTYKAIAKYEPRVSNISPNPGKTMKKSKEQSAKKNIWSKGHLPIAYTVLNPLLVKIESSLLFDKQKISLKPPKELTEILKKKQSDLSMEEKQILKAIPSDIKIAAEKGDYVALDPRLVNIITYRKQPYELYSKPGLLKVFDSLEYKKALRNADLSTLDGISNYILKVTIGNDEYPVTDQTQLETVAELFNTPSKSFDVVWNHTLEIEKIVSPEIGEILGKAKYEQVNEDITGGLGISRALIDGEGHINEAEAGLIVKGLIEEIDYARRQVERWLYKEYRQIAEAVGFERFPKIRWDEAALNDTILFMNTISQLVDRRMLSYQTALETLGFDYFTEKKNMEGELPIVLDGTFGLVGSPFQQSSGNNNVKQDTQAAPKGTPSNGRPTGQPAKQKEKETDPQKVTKNKSKAELDDLINNMDENQLRNFLSGFISELNK